MKSTKLVLVSLFMLGAVMMVSACGKLAPLLSIIPGFPTPASTDVVVVPTVVPVAPTPTA